jgi:Arc/MetJ-type ribon-helix-helix transcriptional regulator
MNVDKKEMSVFVDREFIDYIDKKILDGEYTSRNDFVVSAVRFQQQRMKGLIAQYMYAAGHLIKESDLVRGRSEETDGMLASHSEKLIRNSFDIGRFGMAPFFREDRSDSVRLGVRIPEGLMKTWNFYNMHLFPRMELPNYIRLCLLIYISALNEDIVIENAFILYNDPGKTRDRCQSLHTQICEIVGDRYGYIENKPSYGGGSQ